MENRDRIYYPRKFKQFNQSLSNHEIKSLGLDTLNKLDLFKIAVAYGLDEPKEFDCPKEGLFLTKDIKLTYGISLLNTVKLGVAETNDEIDKYSDININYDEAERCACTGFGKLKELVEHEQDEDLLIKKVIKELENLYIKNVELNHLNNDNNN